MTTYIVTDSAADIPPELAQKEGISVVPLIIAFGEQSYRDYVDITPQEFYQRLSQSTVLPKTSMPPVSAFLDVYRKLAGEGATCIISVHVSAKLSGTFNSARIAAEEFAQESTISVRLVDSSTVSAGMGLPILLAAKMNREGAEPDAIIDAMNSIWGRSQTYFLLDTLTYLERGGRIGKAQAIVGSLLNIKPILSFKEGIVVPVERIRTRPRALNRIQELVTQAGKIESLAIVSSDIETGNEFLHLISHLYHGDVYQFIFGPVVGTYAGPRSAGIFIVTQS